MLRKFATSFRSVRHYSAPSTKSRSEIREEIDSDWDTRYAKYRARCPIDKIQDTSREERAETLEELKVFHDVFGKRFRDKLGNFISYVVGTILGCNLYTQFKEYMNAKKIAREVDE